MFECKDCFATFNKPKRDKETGARICPECGSDFIVSHRNVQETFIYLCNTCGNTFNHPNYDYESGDTNTCPYCGSLNYDAYDGYKED